MDAEHKFKFDDTNETVKERLDKFESRLHQSLTGQSKKEDIK